MTLRGLSERCGGMFLVPVRPDEGVSIGRGEEGRDGEGGLPRRRNYFLDAVISA